MQDEIWKNTEYDGYMVSNLGKVKSKYKILTTTDNGHGYLTVMMSIKNQQFRRYVHRLVAKAFIPNPNKFPQINHKDGNKSNNSIDNLEWCTQKMNNQHAWATGLSKSYERTQEYREKVSKTVKRLWQQGVLRPVVWTDEMKERARIAQLNSPNKKRGAQHPWARKIRCIETGVIFDCIKFADKKYGNRAIQKALSGKQKTAHGLHWEYI
ncbi:MAG: NUMOD4 motif-containing HNH endonuclease [Bacteroidales bacterium]|nr:NUMOD4 motif-containing HNH endonuclease [Bacteroidales bacterium]